MTNTLEFYRNKFCDYQENNVNERRYNKDGIICDIVYYPQHNLYYNNYKKNLLKLPLFCLNETEIIDEKIFLNRLQDTQIKYAIRFLQIYALNKFIKKNYKSITFSNPFYYLFHTFYPINNNIDFTKNIIKILIDNYDDYYQLITDITGIREKDNYILELLYSFLPNDDNNICQICLYTEPKKYLINNCNCKTKTHTSCLLELIKHKMYDCKVCLCKYKINQPLYINGVEDTRIFFPYNDFYYYNDELQKVKDTSRLGMAILYLQVDRVNELLDNKEILDSLPTYYLGYSAYKQTPIHVLCTGNLCSNANYLFGNNSIKYIKILKLLLDTQQFNIEQKDEFNKTPLDYTIQYNLLELKNIINEYKFFMRLQSIISEYNKNKIRFSYNNRTYILYESNNIDKYYVLDKYKYNEIMYSNYIYNTNKIIGHSSKISKIIFNIINYINNLTNNKIKQYKIENKLELEIICDYLLTNNILHTIKILQIPNIILFNDSYYKYKINEKQYDICFLCLGDDYEYNKIRKNYTFYIVVYKKDY